MTTTHISDSRRSLRGKPSRAASIDRLQRLLRFLVGCSLILASIAAAIWAIWFRTLEASASAAVLRLIVPNPVASGLDFISLGVSPRETVLFRITAECTSLVIIVPLTVVAALLLTFTRLTWTRFLIGTGGMVMTVFAVNIVRLVLICWAAAVWGMDSFTLMHVFVGSVVGIGGFVLGLAVLLLGVGWRPARQRRTR